MVGLVVASQCRRHQCEVLESDAMVGGHCRSLVAEGFTFDLGGPHILFSRNKEILAARDHRIEGVSLVPDLSDEDGWFVGHLGGTPDHTTHNESRNR